MSDKEGYMISEIDIQFLYKTRENMDCLSQLNKSLLKDRKRTF